MSEAKKCGPHFQGARRAHDSRTHVRATADTRQTRAAQPKPPAPNRSPRPAANAPVQPKRPPAAPPVYRPQPVPKVLQKKAPPGRPAETTQAQAARPAHTPPRPAAPPVYRPEPKKVAQPKAATPAHALPKPHAARHGEQPPPQKVSRPAAQATLQMKPSLAPAESAPHAAPPVLRPAPRSSVVQRMEIDDEEMQERYGSVYWPPPTKPIETPPTPSYDYYKWSSSYYDELGNTKVFDRYVDFYDEHSGKSVGQTSGTGEEDGFDESYVDIPNTLRPSAPSAKLLWNSIYSPLIPSTTNTKLVKVKCQEKCGQWLYMDKKTKKEHGTSKRPPMCHVIPFNYIRWAAEWVYANANSPKLSKPYKGPDPTGYPADTWKELVWDLSNLRPGHALCNSQTAHQAKGIPSSSDQTTAINYVIKKLHKIEPTWF
jgi:hypothetical protein